jgi:hypothetical protein
LQWYQVLGMQWLLVVMHMCGCPAASQYTALRQSLLPPRSQTPHPHPPTPTLLVTDLFTKVRAVGASFTRFNMVRPDGSLVTATNNTSGGGLDRYNPDGSLQ